MSAIYLQRLLGKSGAGNSQKLSAARHTPPLCSQSICAFVGGHVAGAAVGVPGGTAVDEDVSVGRWPGAGIWWPRAYMHCR